MYDVACVGILVADIIANTVDEMPDRGKLSIVNNLNLFSGGCASNAAIDMAKIGQKVAVIGKVGKDGFGQFLKSSLESVGVNTDGVTESNEVGTSASVAFLESDGERSFLHSFGANGVFCEEDVDYSIIEDSKIVFVAGTLLMPEFDGADCALMLSKAKVMGKTTVLDTAWDPQGRWMSVVEPCLEHLDYFMPSYDEAVQLSGKTDVAEIADYFLAYGVAVVVIKVGSDGCYIKNQDGDIYSIPVYKGIDVKDTTGAGDSFCAGFLTGLSKGLTLEECGTLGNAVGAHCVMEVGASEGIKDYATIQAFMVSAKAEV